MNSPGNRQFARHIYARSRSNSTSSLPPTITISNAEMENCASKEGVRHLNVEYIDRRSGTAPSDRENRRHSRLSLNLPTDHEFGNRENIESDNKEEEKMNHQFTPHMQEKLQRKLKFFFMNPIEKWKAKRRIPWKLILQAIKIIVVTVQLVVFAAEIQTHVVKLEDTKVSLHHIFLKNWGNARDLKLYPPGDGTYAMFSKTDFYESLNFAVLQFAELKNNGLAPYSYNQHEGNLTPLEFCKTYYKIAEVYPFNNSFYFDSHVIENCVDIKPEEMVKGFQMQKFLQKMNFSINFSRLKFAGLKFQLKNMYLKAMVRMHAPICYLLNIVINYDNKNHAGVIPVTLNIDFKHNICHGTIDHAIDVDKQSIIIYVLSSFVIFICINSLALCSRALYRAYLLQQETTTFFMKYLNLKLPLSDRTEFLNMWYITILINDLLIITGSILRLMPSGLLSTLNNRYLTCTITLGIGNLLMWAGLLRYFGFFPKYNILILTLKNAMPDVIRYMLCVTFLYCGFSVCGWLVLGPYHYKFRTLVKTSQCLFSLINGDDMFATFQMVSDSASPAIQFFSQLYLYSFIILFIYVVLSLFIAVIMESYELIKEYYAHGFPKSMLMEFIAQCKDDASSSLYRQEMSTSSRLQTCLRCLKCKSEITDDSYEEIIGDPK